MCHHSVVLLSTRSNLKVQALSCVSPLRGSVPILRDDMLFPVITPPFAPYSLYLLPQWVCSQIAQILVSPCICSLSPCVSPLSPLRVYPLLHGYVTILRNLVSFSLCISPRNGCSSEPSLILVCNLSPCVSLLRSYVPMLRSHMLPSVNTRHFVPLVHIHRLSGLRTNKVRMTLVWSEGKMRLLWSLEFGVGVLHDFSLGRVTAAEKFHSSS